jgi:hypothetical protein
MMRLSRTKWCAHGAFTRRSARTGRPGSRSRLQLSSERSLDRAARARFSLRSSETPTGVIQELYALALAHFVIRSLMFEAAATADLDPDRLSFTGCFQTLRCRLPECNVKTRAELESWYRAVLWEMQTERAEPRRLRPASLLRLRRHLPHKGGMCTVLYRCWRRLRFRHFPPLFEVRSGCSGRSVCRSGAGGSEFASGISGSLATPWRGRIEPPHLIGGLVHYVQPRLLHWISVPDFAVWQWGLGGARQEYAPELALGVERSR